MNIFNPSDLRALFDDYSALFQIGIFLIAFGLTYYLIPKVLWVTWKKRLFKEYNRRSSHRRATPNFGGVVFFTVLILFLAILQSIHRFPTGNHLIAAMTLLFMVGLKDDLVISTARVKLVGQLVATFFIIFSPEFQLTDLHGFLGINEIPSYVGLIFAAFIVVASTNSYNLIDGINGLAGVTGIIVSLCYGVVFYLTGRNFFLLICLVVGGILLAFLRYNLSHNNKRIFMGDSGSLVMGLVIGALSLRVLNINEPIPIIEDLTGSRSRLLFISAVLFTPIFDTARVMIVRLSKGVSPFEADQNHLHHIFLKKKYTHLQASMRIGLINLICVLLFFILSRFLPTLGVLAGLLLYCALLLTWIGYTKKKLENPPSERIMSH